MSFLSSIKVRLKKIFRADRDWKDIEYFDANWEDRVKRMAAFIDERESVMDLGCGQMTLRKYLSNNWYIPVDYTKRDAATIVCDFNKKEFPAKKADTVFISGCLEYLKYPVWFIQMSCEHSHKVVLSYCCTDEFPDLAVRKQNHWVNNLAAADIISSFQQAGFSIAHSESLLGKDRIMVFKKI